jgi:uncharacterized protein
MKVICAILMMAFSAVSMANTSLPPNRHISVHGTAKITAKPDIAKITFEVKVIKDQALEAKKEVDKRVNKLLDGMKKFGVNEDNVSASNLLTEPHVTYKEDDTEANSGYVATRTLKVTLNNLKQLNDFIDFALSVEINEIEDIELMSSNAEKLRDRVNALAVENAKSKGASLANAFGAELGKIYSINSNTYGSSYGYGSHGGIERIEVTGSRFDPDDLAPGRYLRATINFTAEINVVFDLEVR